MINIFELQSEKQKILEAVLFASGESVSLPTLAKIIDSDAIDTKSILLNMQQTYQKNNSGIQLLEIENGFQLCSNPEYHNYVQKLRPLEPKKSLTQPLLETLAIIAYKQPATKGMVEEIRGVNADHAVNKLLEYGLITECGRMDAPGKPILFTTSEDFLRHFGLRSAGELKSLPL